MELNPLPVGFLGSVLVMLGSFQANSPFTSKIPGSWYIGVPTSPHPGNLLVELGANTLVYLGLFLTGLAWVRLVAGVRRGEAVGRPWLLFWLWVLPLMVAGPLFSRDVYSYAAQGQMVSQGISPYKGGPSLLGTSPFLPTVDPLWGSARAPYGPLFLIADGLLVTVSGHSPLLSVLLLRLVALLSVVAIGFFVRRIATIMGVNRDLAFVLSAANPVLLYTFASAGHNDALMTALMMAGIYLFLKDRRFLGIVVVALAASVKVPAIVAIGFMGYNWTRSSTVIDRMRGLLIALMITAATFVLLGYASHFGLGWISALSTPGSVLSFEDPIDAVGFALGSLLKVAGLPAGPSLVVGGLRIIGDLIVLVVGAFAVLGSTSRTMLRLAGVTLIVTVVLGPVIWPWYLGWGIVLLSLGAGELVSDFLIALTLSALPIDLLGLPTVLAWFGYLVLVVIVWRFRDHLAREFKEAWSRALLSLDELLPAWITGRLPAVLRVER